MVCSPTYNLWSIIGNSHFKTVDSVEQSWTHFIAYS